MLMLMVLVVVLGALVVGLYNRFVRLRNGAESAWSDIDVQLKRRWELVPNLVETVKGYAAHERQTLDSVIRARTNAINAGQRDSVQQQAQAENMLTAALKSIFALSEAYPDLKANQNFLALQEELTATEDRVAYSRQFYNDSVLVFNTRVQTFPRNLIAGPLHFTVREFFDAEPGAEASVAVQF